MALINDRFNVSDIIGDVGESVQIVDKSSVTYNTRGDISGATYTYVNGTGSVQLMTAEDIEVQEGILKPQDIIAFFDYNDSSVFRSYLKVGNIISGSFYTTASSSEYEIKEVIQNPGHYEVHGSKL
ncbi:MAG TPA: hypothetical protein VMX55_04075 [candidate division Zixibacteria bacterium]|nr:hypothetical protein [candidate division Zixibacteria bacterium]